MANWMDLEGSGSNIIKVLAWNIPERTEEIMKIINRNSWCHGLDSNRALPEYRSKSLPLHQLSRRRTKRALFT